MFRQALKLDRGYLTAWTLMGHEYVEMSNTHAAIEAYRRACRKYLGLLNYANHLPLHLLMRALHLSQRRIGRTTELGTD